MKFKKKMSCSLQNKSVHEKKPNNIHTKKPQNTALSAKSFCVPTLQKKPRREWGRRRRWGVFFFGWWWSVRQSAHIPRRRRDQCMPPFFHDLLLDIARARSHNTHSSRILYGVVVLFVRAIIAAAARETSSSRRNQKEERARLYNIIMMVCVCALRFGSVLCDAYAKK